MSSSSPISWRRSLPGSRGRSSCCTNSSVAQRPAVTRSWVSKAPTQPLSKPLSAVDRACLLKSRTHFRQVLTFTKGTMAVDFRVSASSNCFCRRGTWRILRRKLSACIACCAPHPNASTGRSSMRMPWPSGCRPTGSPARCTRWTLASAAPTGCRSPTSPRSTATRSAASIWSWCRSSAFATPPSSTTRTCPARCRQRCPCKRCRAAPS